MTPLLSAGPDVELLRLLADPLRLRIVELLAVEQLCTCHLVELTGARQTNISNHLRQLRQAGVVTSQASGRYTYHRLDAPALESLARRLDHLARQAEDVDSRRRPCP